MIKSEYPRKPYCSVSFVSFMRPNDTSKGTLGAYNLVQNFLKLS